MRIPMAVHLQSILAAHPEVGFDVGDYKKYIYASLL